MGVIIVDTLQRGGSGTAPFPTTKEDDARLSYITVADLPGRDLIPEWKRLPFMRVYVIGEDTDYRLGADVTIAGQVWTEVNSGISPGTYQLTSEKNQANGYVGLESNSKINPIYIDNIYANNAYVVVDNTARNNQPTTTGDIVTVTDTSKIYVKLNNNPPPNVDADYAELLFPGAVLSVNGQVGAVNITVASLLAVPQNATDLDAFISTSTAVTALNGVTATHTAQIAALQADVLALQAQSTGPALLPSYNPLSAYNFNQSVKYQETSGRYNLYVANAAILPGEVPGVDPDWLRIGDYYTTAETTALLLNKANLVGGVVPINETNPASMIMSYIAANLAARNAILPQTTNMRVYVTANSTSYIYQPSHPLADPQGFVEENYTGFGHTIQNSGVSLPQEDLLNFTNGLTALDDVGVATVVKLGGALSESVSITGGNAYNFSLSSMATVNITTDILLFNANTEVDLNTDGLFINAFGATGSLYLAVENAFNIASISGAFPGAVYAADYSANYTLRSLVDKEYVDIAVAGATTPPGAPDRSIQFNNLGAFGGDLNFVYTLAGDVGLGIAIPTARLHVKGSTTGAEAAFRAVSASDGVILALLNNGEINGAFINLDTIGRVRLGAGAVIADGNSANIAIGLNAYTVGGGTAIGAGSYAYNSSGGALAVGTSAAAGTNGVAIGMQAAAGWQGQVSVGMRAGRTTTTANPQSTTVGSDANAYNFDVGLRSVALGYGAASKGGYDISIGFYAGTTSGTSGWYAINIGARGETMATETYGVHSIAIGSVNNASGAYAIALGVSANAVSTSGIAIGNSAVVRGNDNYPSIAIGAGAVTPVGSVGGVAIGGNAGTSSDGHFTAVGYGANAGENAVAFGQGAYAAGNAVALGTYAAAAGGEISIGYSAGTASGARGTQSIQIGYLNSIGAVPIGVRSLSMGYGVNATAERSIMLGSAADGASIANGTANSFGVGWDSATPDILLAKFADSYLGVASRLGIGTKTPAAKLDIYGTLGINGNTGVAGQVLTSQGAAAPIWAAAATTLPGGADKQIQFNNGGAFAGNGGLIYDVQYSNILTNTIAGPSSLINTYNVSSPGKLNNTYVFGEGHVVNANSTYITDSFAVGFGHYLGDGVNNYYGGSSSLLFGAFNNAFGIASTAGGYGAQAGGSGAGTGDFAIALNGAPTIGGVYRDNPGYRWVLADRGSVNISQNTGAQILGHGAIAPSSAIIGGQDHHVPADSSNTAIIGGYGIKARATDPNQTYVSNFNINSVPLNDDLLTQVLVRDSVTGQIKYRTAASLAGGGGAVAGANTQVQFNDAGAFGADAEFFYNKTNNALTIGTARIHNPVSSSIFFGPGAGNFTLTGTTNTGIGNSALTALTTGPQNTAVGAFAGMQINTGQGNVAVGSSALLGATSGGVNVAIGRGALAAVNTGSGNIGIGDAAGNTINIGDRNLAIGFGADLPLINGSFQMSIQNAIYGVNNSAVDLQISTGNIGIYVQTPTARLHIIGGIAAVGGASFKINSGVVLTTPEPGAIENDGTHLYYTTNAGARLQLDSSSAAAAGVTGNVQFNNAGVMAASPNFQWDNTAARLVISSAPVAALSVLEVIANAGGSFTDIKLTNTNGGAIAYTLNRTGGTASNWTMYAPGGSTDLRFNTGGDKVTFLANGNVGIGTTAPNNNLEVADAVAGTSGRLLVSDGNGATRMGLLIVSPSSTQNYSRIDPFNYGGGVGMNLVLASTAGNVGIGTTGPGVWFGGNNKVLEVAGGRTTLKLRNTDGISGILFTNDAVSGTTHAGEFHFNFSYNAGTPDASTLSVASYLANSTTTSPFTITASGRIGINTVSPAQTLVINSGVQTAIELQNAGVAKGYIGAVGAADGLINGSVSGDVGYRAVSGRMLFSANNGASSNLTITTSGYVGIGTIAPGTKLHITHNADEIVVVQHTATDGNPGVGLYQAGTKRGHLQYVAFDGLRLQTFDASSSIAFYTQGIARLYIRASDGNILFGNLLGSGTTTATIDSNGMIGRSSALTFDTVGNFITLASALVNPVGNPLAGNYLWIDPVDGIARWRSPDGVTRRTWSQEEIEALILASA